MYSLLNGTILDSSKNKSRPSTFSGVKFYSGLNQDLGFGVGKQSHTKYTYRKELPMLECLSVRWDQTARKSRLTWSALPELYLPWLIKEMRNL